MHADLSFLTHTDLTLFFIRTRISLFLYAHGSQGSHGYCSRRGAHGGTRDLFEHEIRRRPTDRREVISEFNEYFACGFYSDVGLRGEGQGY